jgi:rsbT co-antagonist protein RsbR
MGTTHTERSGGDTPMMALAQVLEQSRTGLLDAWAEAVLDLPAVRASGVGQEMVRRECGEMLDAIAAGIRDGNSTDLDAPAYDKARQLLGELTETRARQGLTLSEAATTVFALRGALLQGIRAQYGDDAALLYQAVADASALIDALGLLTVDTHARRREDVVARQGHELMELSTPVVKLWEGVLAVPLVGALDRSRAQSVTENLLQAIVETGSQIAIIDITGVPTLTTIVAQHLLKTVAATRLMGADCIISGIRPQIAQTVVHLGVELDVVTKASLADALRVALGRIGVRFGAAGSQS